MGNRINLIYQKKSSLYGRIFLFKGFLFIIFVKKNYMQIANYKNQDINTLILQSISKLDNFQQIKLYEFIIALTATKEKNSQNLAKYAGLISKEDLSRMKQSIEEGCNNIDENEW